MAVRIRLRRTGAKKSPSYRLVVAESTSPRDGRFVEEIGWYDPTAASANALAVNAERALHWLGVGAEPSPTAKAVLQRAGVWEKWQIEKHKSPAQP